MRQVNQNEKITIVHQEPNTKNTHVLFILKVFFPVSNTTTFAIRTKRILKNNVLGKDYYVHPKTGNTQYPTERAAQIALARIKND